jgi:hypothetical protein
MKDCGDKAVDHQSDSESNLNSFQQLTLGLEFGTHTPPRKTREQGQTRISEKFYLACRHPKKEIGFF